jgi:hypothetical protein
VAHTPTGLRLWISRTLIGLVLFFNLQCALAFIWSPEIFAPAFELEGETGSALIRGIGILFLMWNVPYSVAVINPRDHRISLYEAIIMQAIGVVGESLLLAALPAGHIALQATASRFIAFDGAGLVFLLFSAWISRLPGKPVPIGK